MLNYEKANQFCFITQFNNKLYLLSVCSLVHISSFLLVLICFLNICPNHQWADLKNCQQVAWRVECVPGYTLQSIYESEFFAKINSIRSQSRFEESIYCGAPGLPSHLTSVSSQSVLEIHAYCPLSPE